MRRLITSAVAAGANDRGHNAYVPVERAPLFGLIEGSEGFGGAPRWVGEKAKADLLALWDRRAADEDASESLRNAFLGVHDSLATYSATVDEDYAVGAQATIGCVDLNHSCVHVAHIGSHRLYRLRANSLVQVTSDHTIGAGLAALGLTRSEIHEHPARCVVTRCLGALGASHEFDSLTFDIQSADILLFASHEVDACDEDELTAILNRYTEPRAASATITSATQSHDPVPFDRGATALIVALR